MFPPRSRSAVHAAALWLALSGMLLRALIPGGFMPGWTGTASDGPARWLIICPTSPLSAALAPRATPAPGTAAKAAEGAGAHSAHVHHGHEHPAAPGGHARHASHLPAASDAPAVAASATAPASDSHAAHGGHGGHGDHSDHAGHLAAAEHIGCPFAGASAPALIVDVAAALDLRGGSPPLQADRPAAVAISATRERPPVRGPPMSPTTTSS